MTNTERQKLWEERVEACLASGLTRRAWCLEHDFSEQQMGYWVRKLKPTKPVKDPDTERWVGLETSSLGDTGVSIQIGHVTLAVKRGFDHKVLIEVVRTLITVC